MAGTDIQIAPVPYKMKNYIQNYEWGNRGSEAFIPQLLGSAPDGNTPYAELWAGAHVKLPSDIIINGSPVSLYELIKKYPVELLGEHSLKKFGNRLPYLFKILSAGEALSIQVHPNKQQAQVLHSNDPLNYPDDNHKPEIAIAIDSLEALAGFRTAHGVNKFINDFPEVLLVFPEGTGAINSGLVNGREPVKELYTRINQLDPDGSLIKDILDSIEARLKSDPALYPGINSLFIDLKKKYGYDTGLFSLFLLNHITLKPGEALFLEAGMPHAYIRGNIIECMSNSDNVIRAGLTPKFKDTRALLDTVVYRTGTPPFVTPEIKEGQYIYKTSADEFLIIKFYLEEKQSRKVKHSGKPEILFILSGEAVISSAGTGSINILRGESVFLPAFLKEYTLAAEQDSVIVKATLP